MQVMYLDAHVHLRDFNQRHKETVKHGLEVAYDTGVDAVLDMPNTDPPLLHTAIIQDRLKLAQEAKVPGVFYGMYVGLTAEVPQIEEAIEICHKFPQVVGMKLYAGHSVGNIGVTSAFDQRLVYETLTREGYLGILVIHAEKEQELLPLLWNPEKAITHCHARPEKAEIKSIQDQLQLIQETGFKGKVHIAHISSPTSVDLVVRAQKQGVDISCGVSPHHLIYDWNQMNAEQGLLWKMNPPLREPATRKTLLQYLKEGKIDWIETDHAPHTLEEKLSAPYSSGIPGLAWWPLFEEYLRQHDFSDRQIEQITFSNIAQRWGLDIQRRKRNTKDHRADYPFDPYQKLAQQLGWPT